MFDDRVFSTTKRLMVAALQKEETDRPPKRPEIPLNSFHSCTMHNLVTSNSMNLFRLLNLPTEFLWEEQKSYAVAKRCLATLKVVIDTAGRGVALIQEYNKTLTKDEGICSFCCKSLPIIVSDIQLLVRPN